MAYQFANLKREVEKIIDQVALEIPPTTDGIEVVEHDSFAEQLAYINEQDKGRVD